MNRIIMQGDFALIFLGFQQNRIGERAQIISSVSSISFNETVSADRDLLMKPASCSLYRLLPGKRKPPLRCLSSALRENRVSEG